MDTDTVAITQNDIEIENRLKKYQEVYDEGELPNDSLRTTDELEERIVKYDEITETEGKPPQDVHTWVNTYKPIQSMEEFTERIKHSANG